MGTDLRFALRFLGKEAQTRGNGAAGRRRYLALTTFHNGQEGPKAPRKRYLVASATTPVIARKERSGICDLPATDVRKSESATREFECIATSNHLTVIDWQNSRREPQSRIGHV